MNNQAILLGTIRKSLSKNSSIIEEIATILQISYDASHRRVSEKSKFSIEETVKLCQHFSISMDKIFSQNNQKVIVEKTKEIQSLADLSLYFKQSAENLKSYETSSKMFYSAKDIPLFYTIGGTLLSKFKLYVWMNLLIAPENQQRFEKFTVDQSLLEYSSQLQKVYENAEVHEIWNDTTINSTLQQILYFFESGLLSHENATLLYEDLKNLLHKAEAKSSKNASSYHLYYNELLILNNNVLMSNLEKKSLFVPYTMLGYFITEDSSTCNNASEYFLHQIKNSKSLNLSGTRDRKLFFNKANQKVDFYLQKINTTEFDL
ncbi:hypothetical protein GV828_06045 [Flavobacterium sp. NST-5]|uniref:Transcription regulator BetR N-terminal domain-containing protein n=1 Tax=Flavobacterium ichthyis TaxID=2698827 RepID=A0ABW9Z9H8_9FLAO|nr:hypothetical protein [Flavobacterium ichthyis]NBL64760.1 hypothetical protein [Flavobacterium ichthyis]